MKHLHTYWLLVLIMMPLAAIAETEENIAANPHEIRIGIGESCFGHFFMQGGCYEDRQPYIIAEGLSVEEIHKILSQPYPTRYAYIAWAPHVFGEYMYRVNRWFGVGVQTDFYIQSHREKLQNGYGDFLGDDYISDVCWAVVPVARFTYLRRENVSLYSHIGLGYSGNFSLRNHKLKDSLHLPAFGATFIGVSWGREHWFGTFELGCFNTAANYMFLERAFSLSAGYRF